MHNNRHSKLIKKMKTLYKILVITLILNLISCDQNDDTPSPTNKFTSAGLDFETPNCYIEFDEFNDNNANFNLFFLDGKMYDNDANVNGSSGDYLFSTNTTNFVFYNITAFDNPSIEIPQYPNIQTGISYIGSDNDSVIIHDFTIDALTPNFNLNGINFGMPDETTGVIHQPMSGNTKTITINSFNFDFTSQTGDINVDYQFLDINGNTITGHYEGSLGVFLD